MSATVSYNLTDKIRVATACFKESHQSEKLYVLIEATRPENNYGGKGNNDPLEIVVSRVYYGTNKATNLRAEIVYGIEMDDNEKRKRCVVLQNWGNVTIRIGDTPFEGVECSFDGVYEHTKFKI